MTMLHQFGSASALTNFGAWNTLAALVFGLWSGAWGGTSQVWGSEGPPSFSMESFPNLAARNLFDPDRTQGLQDTPEHREEPREQGPRPEFVTLTGTMLHGSSAYAFFSGSQPEYRQILKLRERIEHFTVAQITTSHVVLQSATNQYLLPVGKELRQDTNLEWRVGSPTDSDPRPVSRSTESEQSPAASPGSPAPPSEEMNDVLKRMMERREKEISP